MRRGKWITILVLLSLCASQLSGQKKSLAARTYFGTSGLDFPGVSTLAGEPMGGFSIRCLQQFPPDLHNISICTGDIVWTGNFSKTALIRGFAKSPSNLDQLSVRDSLGKRKLPLSSSPEINDNRFDAWFHSTTNYDLALNRWLYGAAEELALQSGKRSEAQRWKEIRQEWPDLAVSAQDRKLLVAHGIELKDSHRHF